MQFNIWGFKLPFKLTEIHGLALLHNDSVAAKNRVLKHGVLVGVG